MSISSSACLPIFSRRNGACRLNCAPWLLQILISIFLLTALPQAQGQTYRVLHSFSGPPDGAGPSGGLIRDLEGNLYGITSGGGDTTCAASGCGIVFKVDKTGAETVLHQFSGPEGIQPVGGLFRDGKGNLFGATAQGGDFNAGTVFVLDKNGKARAIYSFTGGADGNQPTGNLVTDAEGYFYGTTVSGGIPNCPYVTPNSGCGVVFKVDRAGGETVLYSFTGGTDGGLPVAGVIRDNAGNLYGTTIVGGSPYCVYSSVGGCGTVFKLSPGGTLTTIYSFLGSTDGYEAYGRLIRDDEGNLFGTTLFGGDLSCDAIYGCGVVYRVDPQGKETVLYTFHGRNGISPSGGVIRDKADNLYGAVSFGGDLSCQAQGCGLVFKVNKAGQEIILHKYENDADNLYPSTGFLSAQDALYGTTYGGAAGYGTVFEIHW